MHYFIVKRQPITNTHHATASYVLHGWYQFWESRIVNGRYRVPFFELSHSLTKIRVEDKEAPNPICDPVCASHSTSAIKGYNNCTVLNYYVIFTPPYLPGTLLAISFSKSRHGEKVIQMARTTTMAISESITFKHRQRKATIIAPGYATWQ